MKLPEPEPGLVVRFSYLWHRERRRGAEEGRKDRPCVVMIVETLESGCKASVAPVTRAPPEQGDVAVALPVPVRRHLGLAEEPQWIVLDEVNQFTWPGFDLRPVRPDGDHPVYGFLPPLFYDQLRDLMLAAFDARRVKAVPRD